MCPGASGCVSFGFTHSILEERVVWEACVSVGVPKEGAGPGRGWLRGCRCHADPLRADCYRTADDILNAGGQGASRIWAADLAVTMVDEVENPKHEGHRLAVVY